MVSNTNLINSATVKLLSFIALTQLTGKPAYLNTDKTVVLEAKVPLSNDNFNPFPDDKF